MILIGRGLDFTRENEINRLANILNHMLCSCQGCASNPKGFVRRKKRTTERTRPFLLAEADVTLGMAWFGRFLKSQLCSPFPVAMTKGFHLFPYRTQKLSPSVPMVLDW